jgi:hypothetical protein
MPRAGAGAATSPERDREQERKRAADRQSHLLSVYGAAHKRGGGSGRARSPPQTPEQGRRERGLGSAPPSASASAPLLPAVAEAKGESKGEEKKGDEKAVSFSAEAKTADGAPASTSPSSAAAATSGSAASGSAAPAAAGPGPVAASPASRPATQPARSSSNPRSIAGSRSTGELPQLGSGNRKSVSAHQNRDRSGSRGRRPATQTSSGLASSFDKAPRPQPARAWDEKESDDPQGQLGQPRGSQSAGGGKKSVSKLQAKLLSSPLLQDPRAGYTFFVPKGVPKAKPLAKPAAGAGAAGGPVRQVDLGY